MKTDNTTIPSAVPEGQRFRTVPQAARATGIPSYKIRRAVQAGVIPSYGVLDGRIYVRIDDINAAMTGWTTAACDQISFEFLKAADTEGGSL